MQIEKTSPTRKKLISTLKIFFTLLNHLIQTIRLCLSKIVKTDCRKRDSSNTTANYSQFKYDVIINFVIVIISYVVHSTSELLFVIFFLLFRLISVCVYRIFNWLQIVVHKKWAENILMKNHKIQWKIVNIINDHNSRESWSLCQ